ncbi:MAG TPA: ribosome biogenesis GTPase Der [Acidimicrobiales bacterium]|nr:ribosome biogenesis GTPase Der [Acidimicrobiales bacterium]
MQNTSAVAGESRGRTGRHAAAATGKTGRLPVIVVAGRPNVGKSTLVNRIVGRRAAVVEEKPGVTRDRLELEAEWNGQAFVVVDTGGWLGGGDELDVKVTRQAERAVATADIVIQVVDVTVGITTEDEDIARLLRRRVGEVMLIANKVDNERRETDAWEFVSLGFGDPWMVSALHGRGTGDLLDEIVSRFGRLEIPGVDATPAPSPGAREADGSRGDGDGYDGEIDDIVVGIDDGVECPRVALVGRPNVGKSTLFNRLLGEERSIVHDLPGTTRDAIDTVLETPDGPIRFVDTAGMRRKSRTEDGTEYFAMVRALAALDLADVVLLVIDATEGVTHQDQRLAERIGASGSPVVVILNKWELVSTEDRPMILADVDDRLAFLGESPVVKISAKTAMGVHRIFPALRNAVEAYHRRIPTGELNRAMRAIQVAHPPPGSRIRYAVQGAIDPPTFTLFATRRLSAPYLRYVERKLREEFGLGPTPIKIRVRLRG